jgi:hypothetical protein
MVTPVVLVTCEKTLAEHNIKVAIRKYFFMKKIILIVLLLATKLRQSHKKLPPLIIIQEIKAGYCWNGALKVVKIVMSYER